jgi:hypothetical protein
LSATVTNCVLKDWQPCRRCLVPMPWPPAAATRRRTPAWW